MAHLTVFYKTVIPLTVVHLLVLGRVGGGGKIPRNYFLLCEGDAQATLAPL